MGLDIAEFVIAVEDVFGVDIMERDAGKIDTLGDLVAYIEQATAKAPHSQTEADRVYREGVLALQTFFAKELGGDASNWLPETEMVPLLRPLSLRRRVWRKLRNNISSDIPKLRGKIYLPVGGGVSVFVGFFFGLFVTIGLENTDWLVVRGLLGLITGGFVATIMFWLGFFICSPWFSTVPNDCRTLGGIAKHLVPTKVSLDPDGKVWKRETIEKTVLQIASEQSGLPPEKLSLSMKFIDLF